MAYICLSRKEGLIRFNNYIENPKVCRIRPLSDDCMFMRIVGCAYFQKLNNDKYFIRFIFQE